MALSMLIGLLAVGACMLIIVAAVAVVWAITHDRPPKTKD